MDGNVLDVVEIKDEDDDLSPNELPEEEDMDYGDTGQLLHDDDPLDRIEKELMEFDDNFELDRPHYVNIDKLLDDDDSEMEICPYCSKSFRSDYIQTHIAKHTAEMPYVCEVCNKGFKASNYLSMHMMTHRPAEHYQCEQCHKIFNYPHIYKRHMQMHEGEKLHESNHNEPTKPEYYHCKDCKKTFNYAHVYKRHMRIHEGEKQYRCDRCDFTCFSLEKMREHKIYHDEERNVPCDQCEKMFKDVSSLRRHQQVHAMDGYMCDICLKVYCKQRYLTRHKRRSHMNAPLHACDVCPFSTNNAKTFKSHLQKHDDDNDLQKFKCTMCYYNPKSKQMLVKHIKQVHNGIKKFKCETCDEHFITKWCLQRHQQQFHVVSEYQCETCSQYFTTKQGLTRHWRICPLRPGAHQDDIDNSDLYNGDSVTLDTIDEYME